MRGAGCIGEYQNAINQRADVSRGPLVNSLEGRYPSPGLSASLLPRLAAKYRRDARPGEERRKERGRVKPTRVVTGPPLVVCRTMRSPSPHTDLLPARVHLRKKPRFPTTRCLLRPLQVSFSIPFLPPHFFLSRSLPSFSTFSLSLFLFAPAPVGAVKSG